MPTRKALLLSAIAATALAGTGRALRPSCAAEESADSLATLAERRTGNLAGLGMAIGTIESGQVATVFRGESGAARGLDANTIFEIGSVTKTFTATLLADMVRRGEVSLDDPIDKFLPAGVTAPAFKGRHITLLDLATQTSGLPRLPANMKPANPADPYADYTPELLYAFLSGHTLAREPGTAYEYSNLGVGVLGQLLANRAGTSYSTLVADRIARPLDMTSTATGVSRAMFPNLASGHDPDGERAPAWFFDALAGAGAIRSDLADMLRFLRANMSGAGALGEAMRTAQTPRRDADPGGRIGLVWHTNLRTGIVWHNGQNAGFHSFVGMSADRTRGIVILHNAADAIDDIGFHWLDPSAPLRRDYQALALDPKLLSRYQGTYALEPGGVPFVVTREGGRLYAKLAQQPRLGIYPYAAHRFFYRAVDAQIDFTVDGNGNATGLTLHQNGRDAHGDRQK